eukprot:CAMPEP_0181136044 /NCGR_PEP_ID=MMETSP1071-20121207/32975_1 /TAXON_ID=35127 /ORGANISM="Thalassiosira sp., Strain NH16" /LENGTH=110 /DNA_ID=CAMNT_0023222731 /DNA_START=36 /DNA_END=368 /DNA_ORIENTATION=-
MKLISALALLFTCHASATVVENVEDSNKNKPFVVTKPFNFLLRGAVHADVLADEESTCSAVTDCYHEARNGKVYNENGPACPTAAGGCTCQHNGVDDNDEPKFDCVGSTE